MKPEKKKKDFDYSVKVVIIGDSGVGKTNILIRFCENQFKTNYTSTIGLDFKIKVIPVEDSKIRLQIWDTAGQQRFKNINQTFYKGAIAVILVYSIDDTKSFENVENWIKQIHEHSQAQIIKYLVANKSDLTENRKIDPSLGKKLAAKFDMEFIEVSAKTGENVNTLFDKLGVLVYDVIKGQQKSPTKQNMGKRISLHNKQDIIETEKSCRC